MAGQYYPAGGNYKAKRASASFIDQFPGLKLHTTKYLDPNYDISKAKLSIRNYTKTKQAKAGTRAAMSAARAPMGGAPKPKPKPKARATTRRSYRRRYRARRRTRESIGDKLSRKAYSTLMKGLSTFDEYLNKGAEKAVKGSKAVFRWMKKNKKKALKIKREEDKKKKFNKMLREASPNIF